MNELIIRNPFSPTETIRDIQTLIAVCREYRARTRDDFTAVDLANADDSTLKAWRDRLKTDDAALLAADKSATDAARAAYGLDAAHTQIFELRRKPTDALTVRESFKEMLKAVESEIERRKPPKVSRKRLLIVDCDDDAWKKIETAISKAGVKCGTYIELTKPNHIDRIGAVIAAVKDEADKADAAMRGCLV